MDRGHIVIALAALLALVLAAGGPVPPRRPRGCPVVRRMIAAAFEADRAWRYDMLAPLRVREAMAVARDEAAIDSVYSKLFAPVPALTPSRRVVREVPSMRHWLGVATYPIQLSRKDAVSA